MPDALTHGPSDGPAPTGAAQGSLAELAWLFLRLGTTAFGGPAAHIALLEDEVVRRRGWLTREEFLDLLGATNLIPGPNSTEMAIHVGRVRAGTAGLVVAGACFILPAALMVTAIAWAYVEWSRLPELSAFLYGVKPVIVGVVVQALVGFSRTAIKTPLLAVIAAGSVALVLYGWNEIAVLAVAGAAVLAARSVPTGGRGSPLGTALWGGLVAPWPALIVAAGEAPFSLGRLFLFFLKVGSVLFGSGYVLLAFLRADLVERWGWLTEAQLLDAVAVGQFTPGPVFTTATFIGYLLGGVPGAVIATLGIFLPAFVFVAVSAPWLPRLRASRRARAFLDGVIVASLALMAVVTWRLGLDAVVDLPTAALAAFSAVLLVRFRVNSAWLVLGGGLAGLALGG